MVTFMYQIASPAAKPSQIMGNICRAEKTVNSECVSQARQQRKDDHPLFSFCQERSKASPHAPLGIDPSPGASGAFLGFYIGPEATLPSIL